LSVILLLTIILSVILLLTIVLSVLLLLTIALSVLHLLTIVLSVLLLFRQYDGQKKKGRQYDGQKKNDRQYDGQKKDRQYDGQKKDRQYDGQKKKYKKTNNGQLRILRNYDVRTVRLYPTCFVGGSCFAYFFFVFILHVLIYDMIPNQTIFLWFNSNSMCATSGAGTASPL
jgi:membrane protein implicated in regulation of membrane protease activity